MLKRVGKFRKSTAPRNHELATVEVEVAHQKAAHWGAFAVRGMCGEAATMCAKAALMCAKAATMCAEAATMWAKAATPCAEAATLCAKAATMCANRRSQSRATAAQKHDGRPHAADRERRSVGGPCLISGVAASKSY